MRFGRSPRCSKLRSPKRCSGARSVREAVARCQSWRRDLRCRQVCRAADQCSASNCSCLSIFPRFSPSSKPTASRVSATLRFQSKLETTCSARSAVRAPTTIMRYSFRNSLIPRPAVEWWQLQADTPNLCFRSGAVFGLMPNSQRKACQMARFFRRAARRAPRDRSLKDKAARRRGTGWRPPRPCPAAPGLGPTSDATAPISARAARQPRTWRPH